MEQEEKEIYLSDERLKEQVLQDIFRGLGEEEICKKLKITPEIFVQIKNLILKEVKTKSDKAEITSHAVRYFRELINERQFNRKCMEYNVPEMMIQMLYQIAKSHIRPTYGVIFMLRKNISPSMWYYKENEKLPEPITFVSQFEKNYENYDNNTKNELAQKKTLGHIYFDILKENKVMAKFCSLHNTTLTEAVNFVTMRHHKNGTLRYTTRPTIVFVSKFINEIHPDYWYIFPEEVSKKEYNKVVELANETVHKLNGYY